MAHSSAEQLIEQLEEHLQSLPMYDRQRVAEWSTRLNDQDPFDRQDLTDMRELAQEI